MKYSLMVVGSSFLLVDYKFLLQTGIPKYIHVAKLVSNILITQMTFLDQTWLELDLIYTLPFLVL